MKSPLLFGLITLFFSESLLRLMGAEGKVLTDGVTYFRIVAIPSIFISLMFTFGSILRAAGDTKTPMKVSWWINLLHIGLDYVFIFGIFGIEGLGVAGAAWATVIVRILGTLLLFFYIKHSKVSFLLFGSSAKEDAWSIIKLSAPTALERLILRFGQVVYFGLILKIGADVYASHSIAGILETFFYMPGYGLAIAATTLVGQSIGANYYKDAYKYGILTLIIGVSIMSIGGGLLFFLSPWMATWFTDNQAVMDMIITALRIGAFAQPALAMALVLGGALQGAGDTKSPMYSTAIGICLIRVLGVYILGIHLEMGIAGVWLSIVLDLYIRALFLFFKFKKVKESVH